jgi:hypothetical protein
VIDQVSATRQVATRVPTPALTGLERRLLAAAATGGSAPAA